MFLILLTGCAALSPAMIKARKQTLDERVNGYMQAQVDKDWNAAYSYFDTATRKKILREQYVYKSRKLSYTGFTIEETNVLPSGDEATVKVRITLFFMGYEFPRAPQTQQWVKEKGAWFVKADPPQSQPLSLPGSQK